jgi:predicted enzyme related to lactoylglutathione lyase
VRIEDDTSFPSQTRSTTTTWSSISDSDKNFNPVATARVNGCIIKKATGINTPVVLVEVSDLEEAARKVLAAGGSVVSEKSSS